MRSMRSVGSLTLAVMGALRRPGQDLGLVFRDEDAWRPVGWTPPAASASQPGDEPPAKPGAAGRPWWYLTWPASQNGLILIGTSYAFLGLGGLVLYALGGGHIWYLFSSLVSLALGSIHLASAVARSRRER
jgi:hypothetical protein